MSDFELPDQQRIVIRNTNENKQSSPVEPGGYVILFILGIAAYLWNFIDNCSVHDKFHRTLILSGFCFLKIAKISLNSSFFPKPIKR